MSALSKTFQAQWRDLTNSPYIAAKRESGWEKRRQLSTRRSRQLIGVLLIAFFLILTWQYYTSQVEEVDRDHGSQTRAGYEGKYAIVTFETRDVTYWRESLGNKFTYARRHGYSKVKISNVSYEVFSFFQKPKYDNKGGVWSKIVLVNETLETGKFE